MCQACYTNNENILSTKVNNAKLIETYYTYVANQSERISN